MTRKIGRPVDPDSERSRRSWVALGMSRATYYWKKRYSDLPKPLTADDVRTIKQLGLELNGYKWIPLVAGEYGVDQATIMDILNERTHRDVAV